ncbi:hypothetical protein D3C78_779640 [compost metagenome]
MQKLNEIKDWTRVQEFQQEWGPATFARCEESLQALNKTLETSFVAVFRNRVAPTAWKDGNVSWDGEDFYVLTASGRVMAFYNSEWGGVEVITQ